MNVVFGSKKDLHISGRSVSGVSFKTLLVGNAVNVNPTVSQFLSDQVFVQVKLKRAGREHIIASDMLNRLAMESTFNNALFRYSNPQIFNNGITMVTATGGLAGQILVPQMINFGSVINLKGDDELIIEVNTNTSGIGATISSSSSYIEFDAIEAVGVESYIPLIRMDSISPNESSYQQSCGDNVQAITFINTDKALTDTAYSTAPLINVSLTSDKLNINDTYYELTLKRNLQYPILENGNNVRAQCFRLYADEIPLQQANLYLQLTPSNIVAGQNFIATRVMLSSPELLMRAQEMNARHFQQNMAQIYGVAA